MASGQSEDHTSETISLEMAISAQLRALGERLSDCNSQGDVELAFLAFIAKFGFTSATYIALPFSPLRDLNILPFSQDITPFWADVVENSHHLKDPLFRAIGTNGRLVQWQLDDAIVSQKDPCAALRKLANQHGIRCCVALPVLATKHHLHIIGLTGLDFPKSMIDTSMLMLGGASVYARWVTLARLGRKSSFLLTEREAEVAKWMAEGKTDWEIGQILKISAKTVNFHAENVKRKCGVATRVQAVVAILREMDPF